MDVAIGIALGLGMFVSFVGSIAAISYFGMKACLKELNQTKGK